MADHRDTPADDTVYTDEPVTTEDRREVVSREREEHGGVKVGSAFFGWLTATGMAVLLTALAAAAGAAVSVATGNESTAEAADAVGPPETVGLIGGIVLLVILFLSYYSGGFVAGRMARFDGLKQGVAVWVWAIVVAIIVGVLGYFAGDDYNVLQNLDSFPRIPVGEGDVTTGGIIALVLVVLVTLFGAMAGGLAGMRFHRKVDRTGLGS